MVSHAARLKKLQESVAKLQRDKEARLANTAAVSDPSLQKYFPEQTGAYAATQLTQRVSPLAPSGEPVAPQAGDPVGPSSTLQWTKAEIAAPPTEQQSPQAQAQ